MIDLGNFDLMKNAVNRRSNQLLGILTSWKMAKNSISWIWSHEIWPPDSESMRMVKNLGREGRVKENPDRRGVQKFETIGEKKPLVKR